ncbi:MAG: TIGR03960 family B12-binding radical SAM protein, partial [Dehalococcoidales bacterium]
MDKLDTILHRVRKPARYTGGEWNAITKDWDSTLIKTVLIYPDTYEIGMSNMAIPILYDLLNRQPDVLAERAFTPWTDMEEIMRQENIPPFSLETRQPLNGFDIIGFSLGYELTYTNVLNMLDLAGIPVLASERNDTHPLVIAGGSCVLNPEPMSDFIDLFVIGDGEEVVSELIECYRHLKEPEHQISKNEFLLQASGISGIYVPRFYTVEYKKDGLIGTITPTVAEAVPLIRRRIIDKLPQPITNPVVPYIEVIHDRGAIEVQRGCSHGCRFCQAGITYRPVRERPPGEVLQAAEDIILNCGYNELSLVSLSTSDYSGIADVVSELLARHEHLAISLPSLFIDSFSIELMDSLSSQKRTGLTFAPEAGSERLRRVINKNVTEEQLISTATDAFSRGWNGIKLYFMLGLPGETREDVEAISDLVEKVYRAGRQAKGRPPQIRINVSTFVPKPHTPFQWAAQESEEELEHKQGILRNGMRRKGVKLSWGDNESSLLEAVLSRGDRRIGQVIYRAWQLGCRFDSWNEHFSFEKWRRAFEETGIDPDFYARRRHNLDEILPWSHIDTGISPEFLEREHQHSLEEITTRDCRTENCNACGLEKS